MTTKRLHDLNLKDAGVLARLEKMSGSLGGLFFEHEMRWEGKGQKRKLVEHVLAAQVSECQMDDTDILAEPRAGRGATLQEAAAQLEGHLLEWFGEKERKVVAAGRFYKVGLQGTGLSVVEVRDRKPLFVEKHPHGGFRREMVERDEPYTGGIGQMLEGMGH